MNIATDGLPVCSNGIETASYYYTCPCAVKVIDDRGNELMVVKGLKEVED